MDEKDGRYSLVERRGGVRPDAPSSLVANVTGS